MTAAVRIVGVGQPFAGDDGVGIEVVRRLRERPLPPGVEARELEDPSALVELAAGAGRLIVVDAVRPPPRAGGRAAAGQVRLLGVEDLAACPRAPASTHGLGVAEALALVRLLVPRPPEVVIVGITIPPARRYRTGLSPAVARAVPRALRLVSRLVKGGRRCTKSPSPPRS